jgi:hypothetical protein
VVVAFKFGSMTPVFLLQLIMFKTWPVECLKMKLKCDIRLSLESKRLPFVVICAVSRGVYGHGKLGYP